jgi:hypothetical protein
MTRTTITPSSSNVLLAVPEKYIGRKIEVLMFDVDEVTTQPVTSTNKLKPSQLRGFLSKETAENLQKHIQKSRNEWDTL